VGIVDEVGLVFPGEEGQRAGVAGMAATDNTCRDAGARFSQLPNLKVQASATRRIPAIHGGTVGAVVAIPETLRDAESSTTAVRRVTTFDSLRNSGALPGDLVAIQGIGGLGHLAIQFDQRWLQGGSYRARGAKPRPLARSSEPVRTSIPNPQMQQKLCNSWAALGSFWPPPQTQKLCPNSSTVWGQTAS